VSGANKSGKLADTHPIRSISYLDLGVFAVADVTAKYPDAFTPADLIAWIPNALWGLQGCSASTMPLTSLAWFARG
jgi:hypothetical protein